LEPWVVANVGKLSRAEKTVQHPRHVDVQERLRFVVARCHDGGRDVLAYAGHALEIIALPGQMVVFHQPGGESAEATFSLRGETEWR
jgi:hypothetical protein